VYLIFSLKKTDTTIIAHEVFLHGRGNPERHMRKASHCGIKQQ